MNRRIGPLVLHRAALWLLFGLHAAGSFFSFFIDPDLVTLGIWLCQPALLGMWAVLGPRPLLWQFPQAVSLAAIGYALSIAGIYFAVFAREPDALDVGTAVIIGFCYVASGLAGGLAFGICRLAFGWRIAPNLGRDFAAQVTGSRLTLQVIFRQTTLTAIALAVFFQLPIRWELESWRDLLDADSYIFLAPLAGLTAPLAAGMTLLFLASKYIGWRRIIVGNLLMWCAIASILAMNHLPGPVIPLPMIFSYLLSAAATLALNLLLLRLAGYRLLNRRALRDQAASSHEIDVLTAEADSAVDLVSPAPHAARTRTPHAAPAA